jgi:hypothetical protein
LLFFPDWKGVNLEFLWNNRLQLMVPEYQFIRWVKFQNVVSLVGR